MYPRQANEGKKCNISINAGKEGEVKLDNELSKGERSDLDCTEDQNLL